MIPLTRSTLSSTSIPRRLVCRVPKRAHAGRSWMGSLLRGQAADAGRGQLS